MLDLNVIFIAKSLEMLATEIYTFDVTQKMFATWKNSRALCDDMPA